MVRRLLATLLLPPVLLSPQERANAPTTAPSFNIEAQTTCENEMLGRMSAKEVFSGKAYEAVREVARAYHRPMPHLYVFPDGMNMGYIAGSSAVDGRGKIIVGEQAIDVFDSSSLEGFLAHEMAHLVSDSGAQGCNDYIIRDPQMEANADALAARTLGTIPVKAFLQRVLTLTQGENWDARRRLQSLQ